MAFADRLAERERQMLESVALRTLPPEVVMGLMGVAVQECQMTRKPPEARNSNTTQGELSWVDFGRRWAQSPQKTHEIDHSSSAESELAGL